MKGKKRDRAGKSWYREHITPNIKSKGTQVGGQCPESGRCRGLCPGLHSLTRSLKDRIIFLGHFAILLWVAVPREIEEEWKFVEHALLGWPKGTCHRSAKKEERRMPVTPKLVPLKT